MNYQIIKRTFDLFFSILSILLLSPFLITIILMIFIFDGKKVIFCQERVGRNGKIFTFYKFRSMPINTGDIPSEKLKNIKITLIGKIIRRFNIDELPQLFNILKGDMSFVGPRPCIKSQSELITLRKYNNSHKCTPGLTGFAQIKAYSGMPYSEKAKLDAIYSKNISFKFDLEILLKTFVYLFKTPPVY